MEGNPPMFQLAHDSSAPLPSHEQPLAEIVASARGGDAVAFTQLYQMHHARICTYLARMVGSAEEGEDLAQETFIKAWQFLPGMNDDLRFGAWFYRIATNTALDYLRKQQFRKLFGIRAQGNAEVEQMSISGPGLEEQVADTEYFQLALKQLSPQYRACLLLQIQGGFSQREIATFLNMSEKNVSVYVRRGSEQFRQAYEDLEKGRENSKKRRSMR